MIATDGRPTIANAPTPVTTPTTNEGIRQSVLDALDSQIAELRAEREEVLRFRIPTEEEEDLRAAWNPPTDDGSNWEPYISDEDAREDGYGSAAEMEEIRHERIHGWKRDSDVLPRGF
jgi:hypothetical protein